MAPVLSVDAPRSDAPELPASPVPVPDDAVRLGGPLLLRDGSVVSVRPIQPDDGDRLVAFHARLSPETIGYRYFTSVPVLAPALVEHLTHVDYERRMALVATIGQGSSEQILAVVRYEFINSTTAEVAFVVEDRWQGDGIA
ncbi:MAG TPA: hypothetical protein VGR57_11930, partial [Ktedonobacterales bacterium]|nr:hypothetical protein [Ktedonobacterales bacterium]